MYNQDKNCNRKDCSYNGQCLAEVSVRDVGLVLREYFKFGKSRYQKLFERASFDTPKNLCGFTLPSGRNIRESACLQLLSLIPSVNISDAPTAWRNSKVKRTEQVCNTTAVDNV